MVDDNTRSSYSRRRFLQSLTVAALTAGSGSLLTACGDATPTPASSATTAAATTVASGNATTAASTTVSAAGQSIKTKAAIFEQAKKYTGTKLNLSVVGTSPPLPAVMDEWQKATGVTVETTAIPPNDIFEKLILNFTSNAGNFDLVSVVSNNYGAFAPYLLDMTSLHAKYKFDEVQLVDMFKWYGIVDNVSYGVPYDGDQYMLFYRTDWLEKVGGDPNKPPATWDEVYTFAQKMQGKDLDGSGTGYGFAPRMSRVGTWQFFATKLAAFGGDWFDENWQPAINSPQAVAALEYAVKLKDVGPPNSVSIGFADLDKLFLAGQVGFMEQFSTTATKAQFDTKNSKVVGKVGVARLPAGPGGSKRVYSPGGVSLSITKTSKNQELAYLFARYLACEETAVTQALAGTGVEPTMVSAYNNPDFQSKWGDGKNSWKVALDMGSSPIFTQLVIPDTAALNEALDLKLSEAYSGQTPPKAALDSVASSWRQILGRSGYYTGSKPKYKVQNK
jgi:ABC-type glycerol-3-phosphate transport system substrate-binding protein